ncbi:hypothetical protein ACROSR_16210 [Roseovarius tibetensis]|uniref:hypothetical protein n=1 Tax=Roseovarius tibetensis TaxID=2685897 RepID=UPI003D7FE62A
MSNQPTEKDPLDEMVNLNFRVSERERRAFKPWCAVNGMTQTEGFRAGFELLKQKRQET